MALKLLYEKEVQIIDLGTYSIKFGRFKLSKTTDELIPVSKEVYKVPASYAGAEVYMEAFGQYLKDIAPHLEKKIPICFSFSSLFAPTNLSYLTRVEKDKVHERMKEEIDKFASQEKIPAETDHNKFYEMFRKETDAKCQVIAASIICNPKYIGIIKKHLYNNGLKFGGIYPLLQSSSVIYNRLLDLKPELKEEPVAMVDIGHLTTKVHLFFQEKLLFYKVLHYGSRNFYEELFDSCSKSGDTTLSPQDVEALLQRVGFTGNLERANQMELDVNDLRPYLNQLDVTLKSIFSKVSSSINYFISALARNFTADNNAFMAVRKGATHVLFSGGITNAPGFMTRVQESFNVKIHVIQPFDLKGTLENELKGEENEFSMSLRENSPFVDCLGAGFLELGTSKKAMNLVSNVDSAGENLLKDLMKLPLVKYRNALIGILVVMVIWQVWKVVNVSSEYNKLNKTINQLQNSVKEHQTMRTSLQEKKQISIINEAKYGYIKAYLSNHIYWPELLRTLMQQLSSEIKINTLTFITREPTFTVQKLKRWVETQDKMNYPWTPKTVEFSMSGSALSRTAVPQLINTLTETGIFSIPKPPGTAFVPAQVVRRRGSKPGQEEEETIAAHYTFTLEGYIQMDNTL